MKKLSSFFVRSGGDGEKKKLSAFENLIIIVVVGVIIILAGGLFTKPGGGKDTDDTASQGRITGGEASCDGEEEVTNLERRLSELLSKVEGAGNVEVMIFADSSSEVVPAYNDELDSRSDEQADGRSIETRERRELAASGGEGPVVLKVIIPEIKGVVVVAEGADDFNVKQQLNSAVCTLLGVPEHRVQILKHK